MALALSGGLGKPIADEAVPGMGMRIYYRISEASKRTRSLPWATREKCLENFLSVFEGCEVTILADNCSAGFVSSLEASGLLVVPTSLGNSGSFRFALDLFLEESERSPESSVYFVEDDYIHRPDALGILEEGLRVADYITLYDHPDKYSKLYDFGETSKVFLTESCHWKTTCSTCMTFASSYPILEQDRGIWYEDLAGDVPLDHEAFLEFGRHGRMLASPIPGYSTHAQEGCLSPMVDWILESKTPILAENAKGRC